MREYYPAALVAFDDLADRDALAVLGRAPTPADAAPSESVQIRSALKTRWPATQPRRPRTTRSRRRCAREQLAAPAAVTAAFAATTRAAVGIIVELNRQIAKLEADAGDTF